jgi:hypothetical protein
MIDERGLKLESNFIGYVIRTNLSIRRGFSNLGWSTSYAVINIQ